MPDDALALSDMFYANLSTHSGYISHGEVQMGVGKLSFDGEKYVPSVVPESRPLWHTYLMEHIDATWRCLKLFFRTAPLPVSAFWKTLRMAGTISGCFATSWSTLTSGAGE